MRQWYGLLAAACLQASTGLRIAYVVSTWWPKIDGAAIAVMGHVRHFVAQGHDTLVVRPEVNKVLLDEAVRANYEDPLPNSEKLSFVDYSTVENARAGGYELVIDPMRFEDAERKLTTWKPDVILVMDPDLFMFDAFRIPGFRSRGPTPPPVTIACFTTYFAEAVRKMPDFWWIPAFAEPLLHAGVAMAYGGFDHIFVNGEPTRVYLETRVKLGLLGGVYYSAGESRDGLGSDLALERRTTVVSSRGVAPDFCTRPAAAECEGVGAAAAIGAAAAGSPSFVYVGRLAYDKYADELLAAYAEALDTLKAKRLEHGAVLYLAGSGELTADAQALERRYPGKLRLLGSVAPHHVSCVLRKASVYISSAPNETYGRAQVEALRCSLPLLTMSTKCNMHVEEGVNGLLAPDRHALASNIVRVVKDAGLLRTLREGAARSSTAPQLADPNAKMLEAIVATHAQVMRSGRQPGTCWHLLWTALFWIGKLIDGDHAALTVVALLSTGSVFCILVVCMCFCCTSEQSTGARPYPGFPVNNKKKKSQKLD